MITNAQQEHAHVDVDYIFREILPEYGMNERAAQTALCHTLLDTMFENRISLSDAGTGIGKTYAYLVAGVVFNKYRLAAGEPRRAVVISTASIALQTAIQEEYIPFLSNALKRAGYLTRPILSVLRKGKSRYVCDKLLKQRLRHADLDRKNRRAADALLSLKFLIDMDEAKYLSGYDREQVAVPRSCDCNENCRYKRFVAEASLGKYLFQICNHNLLLANAIHARHNQRPILPAYCALVVDEAHRLPAAARQMFGRTLSFDDIRSLVRGLRSEHCPVAAQEVMNGMRLLVKGMAAESDDEIAAFEEQRPALLAEGLKALTQAKRMAGDKLSRPTYLDLCRMITTFTLFMDADSDFILYVERDDRHEPVLCAAAADLSTQMNDTLWSQPLPILLTSGTLAVGGDFSRFRTEACIPDCGRVVESVYPSPFEYERNCLLYVPHRAPQYDEDDLSLYYSELAEDIRQLVGISRGHALVLFNSYSAMSAVMGLLEGYCLPYPIYTMSRNNPHIADEFKKSGNGVLLATGAAWEGMDFPGDMVSMLIIPRLPFPIPDAVSEYQKECCGSLEAFIEAVALPDMQIKLRQGFGRAIRLETDTCIVAVLDERSLRGRRYHDAMRTALPGMPMTGSLNALDSFLRSVKDEGYFAGV